MKIIHTVASIIPETGGPSRSVPSLCQALAIQGLDIDLISSDLSERYSAPLLPDDKLVNTILKPSRYNIGLRQIWLPGLKTTLYKQIESDTIIHDHGLWLPMNHTVAAVARKSNVPLVISPRGMLEPFVRKYGYLLKKTAWFLYQNQNIRDANLLHATSCEEAGHLREIGLTQPIAIIPNGVSIPPDTRLIRNNGNARMHTLLFLSRIHPKKGLLDLVKAVAQAGLPDCWKIVIAGPDENGHETEVRKAVSEYGLHDKFTFIGPVKDTEKWQLFRNADLFVLPSYSENFGIVIAEALGCRVPVITTTGTPWQEIETNKCGWWIEPGSESLTYALKEAITLPAEKLQEMGQNGQNLIESKYTWNSIAQKMISTYAWILKKQSKPDFIWA